jgi:hypothetical protein
MLGALALAAVSCEERRSEPPPAPSASEPSPNASIMPAPLAAGPTKATARDAGHAPTSDPGVYAIPDPPRPIREDDTLQIESELRPAPGLSLQARFRWLEAPPPRAPESNVEALNKARDKTALELTLDVSSLGRMRVSFAARAYPLPQGAELRARQDRYGHILVWPNGSTYTALAPGTLRAALSEARLDVTPLAEANVAAAGSGNVLGVATQKQRLETSIGRLELEQAALPAGGAGGALLCRLLLELLAVSPVSSACRLDWVPLHAVYTWASGARFELEVTKLVRRIELPLEGHRDERSAAAGPVAALRVCPS